MDFKGDMFSLRPALKRMRGHGCLVLAAVCLTCAHAAAALPRSLDADIRAVICADLVPEIANEQGSDTSIVLAASIEELDALSKRLQTRRAPRYKLCFVTIMVKEVAGRTAKASAYLNWADWGAKTYIYDLVKRGKQWQIIKKEIGTVG